jgi:hypothetical protein
LATITEHFLNITATNKNNKNRRNIKMGKINYVIEQHKKVTTLSTSDDISLKATAMEKATLLAEAFPKSEVYVRAGRKYLTPDGKIVSKAVNWVSKQNAQDTSTLYTVVVYGDGIDAVDSMVQTINKDKAATLARNAVKQYPSADVCIYFSSDFLGHHEGYYNPDGNHDINCVLWSAVGEQ